MHTTTQSDAPLETLPPVGAPGRMPRRSVVAGAPINLSQRISTLAIAVLVAGVALAILTTRDHLWWQLHFSQLGTFGDFSSSSFNGAVIIAGALLVLYAVFLAADLSHVMTVRSSRGLRWAIASAGLHLTVVGLIPIPVSMDMHDRAAAGLALSFLAMFAFALGLRKVSLRFRLGTAVGVLIIASGMVLLILQVITLAAYEAMAFGIVGAWLPALNRVVRGWMPHANHSTPGRRTSRVVPGAEPSRRAPHRPTRCRVRRPRNRASMPNTPRTISAARSPRGSTRPTAPARATMSGAPRRTRARATGMTTAGRDRSHRPSASRRP
ncbi:DUF998 domain-containing protein [Microbacterium aurantiacum]|uniref:DUF998 domain-containing protein n=1 Tax=Microbacterium aurantiacum TaxID=162393 RepID=UPI001F474AE4|nr:DUF998 domain-containing protein [Microbacterium aurantiacum]